MNRQISPWQVGSSLYIPATHNDLFNVIVHNKYAALKSIIICLEDAVREEDLVIAKQNLVTTIGKLEQQVSINPDVSNHLPIIFIRPRNIEMATWIFENIPLNHVTGFVLPKYDMASVESWWQVMQNSALYMMPTLETYDVYNIVKMQLLADKLVNHPCKERILALRIGGNDLMNGLRLRRNRQLTLYDGPLGYLIKMLVTIFAANGFYLTAPVCEHFANNDLLEREIALDIMHGLVGKTIIHPNQLTIIDQFYKVSLTEYNEAQQILTANEAVFKFNGSMCEPITQHKWALDILERAKYFGINEY